MEEQKKILADSDMGHTMRLGSYPAVLKKGTLTEKLYGSVNVSERHRHRYEVNTDYMQRLNDAGLTIAGTSPDGKLTEFVEIPQDRHPFFVGTQAHPEFKSRPYAPHPLFQGLIKAALDYQGDRKAGKRVPSASPKAE